MKNCSSVVVALLILTAALALGEDFTTVNGKRYKDATVTRVEADGIVIRTKTGISKIYFVELPKDVQGKFHYGQATPTPAQIEGAPTGLESTPDGVRHGDAAEKVVVVGQRSGRPQADKGGRIIVVGQSGVSLKVILAGIVVLVVVVLAVVRSRS